MNKIRKKLQSQDGITILFALLGFMTAAVVSVVIVTAAVSAARRVENDRDITQDHLTLQSAAQLVRDQMTGEYDESAKTTVTRTTSNSGNTYSSSGTFGEEMRKAVNWIDTFQSSFESSDQAIQITVPGYDTVFVSYVMQTEKTAGSGGEYYLIFTFCLDQSSEELYLTMTGNSQSESRSNRTTIGWTTVSINGLGGSSGN